MKIATILFFTFISITQLFAYSLKVNIYHNKKPLNEVIVGIQQLKIVKTSNKNGQVEFENIKEGKYTLVFIQPHFIKKELDIVLKRNFEIDLELSKSTLILPEIKNNFFFIDDHYGLQGITQKDVKTYPMRGAGDSLRLLQSLPGIGGGSSFSTVPIIRSSNPLNDTMYIDGIPIKYSYHYLGAMVPYMSAVNEEVIDSATVAKGPYPLYYHNSIGSVTSISTKEVSQPGFHAKLSLDPVIPVIPTLFTTYSPSEKFSIMAVFRRSNADWLRDVADQDIYNEYDGYLEDHYLKLTYNEGAKHRLTLVSLGAIDYQNSPHFESKSYFHAHSLKWEYLINSEFYLQTQASGNFMKQELIDINSNGIHLNFDPYELRWFQMMNIYLKKFYIKMGYELKYEGGAVASNINFASLSDESLLDQTGTNTMTTPIEGFSGSFFTEMGASYQQFFANVGLKYQYYGPLDAHNFSYRLMGGYHISKDTLVYAGGGLYHSYPAMYYYLAGNNSYLAENSAFLSNIGIKTKLLPSLLGQAEFYYNHYYQLSSFPNITYHSSELKIYTQMHPFSNEGEGKTVGLELFLKGKYKFLEGWVSYAYSYSIRNSQYNAHDDYPSDFDQTHLFKVVLAANLKPWVFSILWHIYSPLPYTSIVGQSAGDPVYSNEYNEGRYDLNSRLDVKINYYWKRKNRLFLEVWNVFLQQNTISQEFDANSITSFSKMDDIPQLFVWIGMELCF